MIFLKVEPKWNNLRDDPHFQELLRRVGLPYLRERTVTGTSILPLQSSSLTFGYRQAALAKSAGLTVIAI